MGVQRFRSVAAMPPPWRTADDPDNLRMVASMLALYRLLAPAPPRGVRHFASIEEVDAESQRHHAPSQRPAVTPRS